MPKMLLVDGNNLVHRLFHVGADARFAIARLLTNLKPDNTIVCFDNSTGYPCWRKQLFPDYKAGRKKTQEEKEGIAEALAETKSWLAESGIYSLEVTNTEADDIIGSLAVKFSKSFQVQIFSSDKDFYSLINDNIEVIVPVTMQEPVTREACKQELGVYPEQVAYYKAMVGDPSDSYKGIPGIGKKTAAKLLQDFGDAKGIYDNLDKIKFNTGKKLIEGKEQFRLCYRLARIRTTYLLPTSANDCLTPAAFIQSAA